MRHMLKLLTPGQLSSCSAPRSAYSSEEPSLQAIGVARLAEAVELGAS